MSYQTDIKRAISNRVADICTEPGAKEGTPGFVDIPAGKGYLRVRIQNAADIRRRLAAIDADYGGKKARVEQKTKLSRRRVSRFYPLIIGGLTTIKDYLDKYDEGNRFRPVEYDCENQNSLIPYPDGSIPECIEEDLPLDEVEVPDGYLIW